MSAQAGIWQLVLKSGLVKGKHLRKRDWPELVSGVRLGQLGSDAGLSPFGSKTVHVVFEQNWLSSGASVQPWKPSAMPIHPSQDQVAAVQLGGGFQAVRGRVLAVLVEHGGRN